MPKDLHSNYIELIHVYFHMLVHIQNLHSNEHHQKLLPLHFELIKMGDCVCGQEHLLHILHTYQHLYFRLHLSMADKHGFLYMVHLLIEYEFH